MQIISQEVVPKRAKGSGPSKRGFQLSGMDKILELLEGTPNGVYAVDLDRRVILWNHEAERILGWNVSGADLLEVGRVP